MKKKVDWSRIEEKYRQLIYELHEQLGWFNEEELKNTPRRATDVFKEWLNNQDFNFTLFEVPTEYTKSMVVLKDIDFVSKCSHHLENIVGKAYVAYLPKEGGKISGISKIARAVRKFASKPQLQERLTNEIADYVRDNLDADFVMVVVRGVHHCMVARGVKMQNAEMVTSAVRWNKERFNGMELGHLKAEALKLFGF